MFHVEHFSSKFSKYSGNWLIKDVILCRNKYECIRKKYIYSFYAQLLNKHYCHPEPFNSLRSLGAGPVKGDAVLS